MTIILGDNIIFDDLTEYVETFSSGARVFLKQVDNPQRFGVPEFATNKSIIKIEEKPKEPKSKYAVTGVYQYDSTVFDRVRKLKPSQRGELEITDVNNAYLQEKKLLHVFLKCPWLDAGTFDSLLDSSNMARKMLEN